MPEESIYINRVLERQLSDAQKPDGMSGKEFAEYLIAKGLEKLGRENSRRQKKARTDGGDAAGRVDQQSAE